MNKCSGGSEMWCRRRMRKFTHLLKNEKLLHRVEKEGNILRTMKGRKAD
jgi:hypothetical protein